MALPEEICPFTLEELIAADVLLGQSEAEARALWTMALEELERDWRDCQDHQGDPGRIFGITWMTGTLLALSLVSVETAARIERYRSAAWEASVAAARTGLISPDELERRREEKRLGDEQWAREREALRRSIAERGRDAGGMSGG